MTEQIQAHIPCEACGYNLRGLSTAQLCPECGRAIESSLEIWRLRRRPREALHECDPRWVRKLAEGAGITLAVAALLLVLVFAPKWAYAWHTPQRKVTLGILCTAWVLAWASAWRLSSPQPGPAVGGSVVRIILRLTATLYLALPFTWAVMTSPSMRSSRGLWEFLLLAAAFAGLVVGPAWLWIAGRLAARAGERVIAVETRVLALASLSVGLLIFLSPGLHRDVDSLSHLMEWAIPPFERPYLLVEVVRAFADREPEPILFLVALPTVWAMTVVPRLYLTLRRAARRAGSGNIA